MNKNAETNTQVQGICRIIPYGAENIFKESGKPKVPHFKKLGYLNTVL